MARVINLNAHRPQPTYPRCEQCRHPWHGVTCTKPRFHLKHHRATPCGCRAAGDRTAEDRAAGDRTG